MVLSWSCLGLLSWFFVVVLGLGLVFEIALLLVLVQVFDMTRQGYARLYLFPVDI